MDHETFQGSDCPLESSLAYQIRAAHRDYQNYLVAQLEPHGVTMGMWYFLRVLWHDDGITQRELSRRVGTMEPTTLAALKSMEKMGFVRRARDPQDQRKMNVCLTEKGRALRIKLAPLAQPVAEEEAMGLSMEEREVLCKLLVRVRSSLDEHTGPRRSIIGGARNGLAGNVSGLIN